MKHFTVSSSDLSSSPTNPAGIWSPSFLALKQALDRGDSPDNVLQALTDWLSTRAISPTQVDRILDLPNMDQAYEALVNLIGGKSRSGALPPAVQKTLRAAIARLAEKYVAKGQAALDQERQRLAGIQGRFTAEGIVDNLLQ